MQTNEKLAEVLNDLIEINNDRVKGYTKAAAEAKDEDADLKVIFTSMAGESKKYAAELTAQVSQLGAEPATDTTIRGKIYRVWMDVKATFTGSNRQALLESCEFGEEAAQKAYTDALSSDVEINAPIRQLITAQQEALKTAHLLIKKHIGMLKAVKA
jgi:uncharacterized protein (TIGR02284 family)